MLQSIKNILEHYEKLNPTINEVTYVQAEKGVQKSEKLVRAAIYFNVKDGKGHFNDGMSDKLREESKKELMKKAKILTVAALKWFRKRNKITKEEYKEFIQNSEGKNSHLEIYEWVVETLMILDVLSPTKVVDYQLIMNYEGEIEAIKRRPEGIVSYEGEEEKKQNQDDIE